MIWPGINCHYHKNEIMNILYLIYITYVPYITLSLLKVHVLNKYHHQNSLISTYSSRGLIPWKWDFLSLHTRELEQRGDIGIDPVHHLSLPHPPIPRFPLNNGVLLRHLRIYIIINIPRHITILGSVLILTAYCTLGQVFKYTISPPHLLMRLQGPQIRGLILFFTSSYFINLAIWFSRSLLEHQLVAYSQILLIVVMDNLSLGILSCPLPLFAVDSTTQGL